MPQGQPRDVVLVVDDSRVARTAVTHRLAEHGVTTCDASGCIEGGAVDLSTIGAAILDLELGDGTGVELAMTLRASSAALPIAFLTSAPTSELAGRARELGPVFEKGPQLADAVAWARGRLAP